MGDEPTTVNMSDEAIEHRLRTMNLDDPSMPEDVKQKIGVLRDKLLTADKATKLKIFESWRLVDPERFEQKILGSPLMQEPIIQERLKRTLNIPKYLHSFTLTRGVVNAISQRDASTICTELEKMDLLHLPFEALWLNFSMDHFMDSEGWIPQDSEEKSATQLTISFVAYDVIVMKPADEYSDFAGAIGNYIHFSHPVGGKFNLHLKTRIFSGLKYEHAEAMRHTNFAEEVAGHCTNAFACLVAALAMKNIVKRTSTNTRLGTAKKPRPQYIGPDGSICLTHTILDVPPTKDMEEDPNHPVREGRSPKPHVRLGHAHTYLYGVGRQERKKLWLAPMFVNGDPSYTSPPRKYVV